MAEIMMNKGCDTCNKKSVCRYTEDVVQKASEIDDNLKNWTLPIRLSVSCTEWSGDGFRTI